MPGGAPPVGDHSLGANFVGQLMTQVHAQHPAGTVVHATSVVGGQGASHTIMRIQPPPPPTQEDLRAGINTPVPDEIIEVVRRWDGR